MKGGVECPCSSIRTLCTAGGAFNVPTRKLPAFSNCFQPDVRFVYRLFVYRLFVYRQSQLTLRLAEVITLKHVRGERNGREAAHKKQKREYFALFQTVKVT